MYPQRELIRLGAHKAALLRRIACHRVECVEAATRVARPLAWLDRALALWRRAAPLVMVAAVPLGFLVKRTAGPRLRFFGSLLRWGPIAYNLVRGIRSARTSEVE